MATSRKLTTEQKVKKSLEAASKILNSPLNIPQKKLSKAILQSDKLIGNISKGTFKLYQVVCPEDDSAIGNPTTSPEVARHIRDSHNSETGHHSRVI